jgi:hypothetical protein
LQVASEPAKQAVISQKNDIFQKRHKASLEKPEELPGRRRVCSGPGQTKMLCADTMLEIIHILLVIAVILLFERLIQAGSI